MFNGDFINVSDFRQDESFDGLQNIKEADHIIDKL
jgi:hypothetical protein